MMFTFELALLREQILICQEIIRAVFHQELGFVGMQIPDRFSTRANYILISHDGVPAGCYRLIANRNMESLPIFDEWPAITQLPAARRCEFSRLAVLPEFRGRGIFNGIVSDVSQRSLRLEASEIIASVLERNVSLFEVYGFAPLSAPIHDETLVMNHGEEEKVCPMSKTVFLLK